MGKEGLICIYLLCLILAVPMCSALGEWSQFQKNENMLAYQGLAGSLKNAVYNNTITSLDPSLQPLVNNFNGERKIIVASNDVYGGTLKILNKNLAVERTLVLNKSIFAITSADWDGDGNTEIMMLINDTYSMANLNAITYKINFTVYEYIPTGTVLTEEKNIGLTMSLYNSNNGIYNKSISSKIGNIVCGKFVGNEDCMFIIPLNLTRVSIFSFNYTSTSASSNPFNTITRANLSKFMPSFFRNESTGGNRQYIEASGKTYFSLADIDNDGDNEINFVWGNTYNCLSECSYFSRNAFFSIANNYSIIRNFTVNYSYATVDEPNNFSSGSQDNILNTITKIENVGFRTSEGNKVLIAINRKSNTAPTTSLFSVYNMSGGCVYPTQACYQEQFKDGGEALQLDFIVSSGNITIFSNAIDDFAETGDDTRLFIKQIEPLNNGVNTHGFYNNRTERFNGFIKGTDWDNDGELEFLTQYGIADLNYDAFTHVPQINTFDFDILNGSNGETLEYSIPADIDSDYQIDLIFMNTTTAQTGYGEVYINNLPSITNVFYSTGNPICIGSNSTYAVNYTDFENDSIYLRVDCLNNGTYLTSGLSQNPTVSCNYSEIGNYNTQICIRDFYHGTFTECKTVYVSTSTGGCYNTNENGGNSSYIGGTGGSNTFGIYRDQFRSGRSGYTSQYFDYSKCEKYTVWYGLCPVIIWVTQTGNSLIEAIFTGFQIFLGLLLIFVIIAIILKKRGQ